MSNEFYNHSSYPTQGSVASSASMRAELDAVAAGFDKLPPLSGNGGKTVKINASGTGLEAVTVTGNLPLTTSILKGDGVGGAAGASAAEIVSAIGVTPVANAANAATAANATAVGGTTPTAAGLALLDDANAAAQRTTLGLGTAATATLGTGAGQVPTADQVPALASSVPSGAVMAFAMSSAPTGWLKANGAAVSRATYSALFSAVGTTYGSGDGSTTFNLPDLRGEFVRGWDDARGIDSGRAIGTSQADDFKSHSHGLGLRPNLSAGGGVSIDSGTAHPQSGSTYSTGGSETRPRNIAMLYCIKT